MDDPVSSPLFLVRWLLTRVRLHGLDIGYLNGSSGKYRNIKIYKRLESLYLARGVKKRPKTADTRSSRQAPDAAFVLLES